MARVVFIFLPRAEFANHPKGNFTLFPIDPSQAVSFFGVGVSCVMCHCVTAGCVLDGLTGIIVPVSDHGNQPQDVLQEISQTSIKRRPLRGHSHECEPLPKV